MKGMPLSVPSARKPESSFQTPGVPRAIALLIGTVGGLWLLYQLASLVLLLILAGLFAYVLAPLVQLAERPIGSARKRRLPRGVAIGVVYALTVGVLGAGSALLLPIAARQIDDAIVRAPAYGESLMTWERGWSKYYGRLRIPIEVRQSIDQSLHAAGDAIIVSARGSLVAVAGALSNLPSVLLVPILAFFLLKDGERFRRTVVTTLPHDTQLRMHRLFEEVNSTLAAYTRAQLLACVLIGSLCGVAFALLGVSYPLLLAVLAGVLEFIPLVGPLVLAMIASIVGALQAPMLGVWVLVFLAVLRLLEDYVIYPRLIRHGLHLHPLGVIVAVLAGAELYGVAGMFLAVPTVAIATVIYRHARLWRRDEV